MTVNRWRIGVNDEFGQALAAREGEVVDDRDLLGDGQFRNQLLVEVERNARIQRVGAIVGKLDGAPLFQVGDVDIILRCTAAESILLHARDGGRDLGARDGFVAVECALADGRHGIGSARCRVGDLTGDGRCGQLVVVGRLPPVKIGHCGGGSVGINQIGQPVGHEVVGRGADCGHRHQGSDNHSFQVRLSHCLRILKCYCIEFAKLNNYSEISKYF